MPDLVAPLNAPGASWGNVYWPIGLLVVALAFLGPEIYALVTNAKNTLSWWVWDHDLPGGAAWYLSLGTYLVVTSWLVFHFWFQKYK